MPTHKRDVGKLVACMKPTNHKDMKTINLIAIQRINAETILINFHYVLL